MTTPGLSGVTEQDLLALSAAIDRGDLRAPVTETSLQARGLGHLAPALRPYLELGPDGPRLYGGGYSEYVAASGHEAPGLH